MVEKPGWNYTSQPGQSLLITKGLAIIQSHTEEDVPELFTPDFMEKVSLTSKSHILLCMSSLPLSASHPFSVNDTIQVKTRPLDGFNVSDMVTVVAVVNEAPKLQGKTDNLVMRLYQSKVYMDVVIPASCAEEVMAKWVRHDCSPS